MVEALNHLLTINVLQFPLVTFLFALLITFYWLASLRSQRGRQVRVKVLLRALFPTSFLQSKSERVDLVFALFNSLVYGAIFSAAIISLTFIANQTHDLFVLLFGARPPSDWPEPLLTLIVTLVGFLVYEMAYFSYHILCHRIGFLWQLHKIHHAAESLSPFTRYREHPLSILAAQNLTALWLGFASGVMIWSMGKDVGLFQYCGINVFIFIFYLTLEHLQHMHVWIPFTGPLGQILLSPAHHQLHHSRDKAHYDCNFGAFLGVWDWMAGTLIVPSQEKPKLTFGVEGDQTARSVVASFFQPVQQFLRSCEGPLAALFERQADRAKRWGVKGKSQFPLANE